MKTHPRSILVIRLSSLGDIILTGPTTLNLKLAFPESRITYLTREPFHALAAALPGVDQVQVLGENAGAGGLMLKVRELERQRFDLIVDLHGNLRSRALRAFTAASKKVTYPKRRLARERIVRRKRTQSPVMHVIDSYNQALRRISPAALLAATGPLLSEKFGAPENELPEKIRSWLAERRRIILLAPGARHANKRAPTRLFASAADLLDESDIAVVSVITGEEHDKSLSDSFPEDRYTELVDAPLELLVALMRRSAIALSNDSGVAHLCSGTGLPVITLFGPTHTALGFAPRGVFDRVLEVDERCRPCSLHGSRPCFREERFCFTRITRQGVTDALRRALDIRKSLAPALFVDRDGTLIVEKEFLSDVAGVEFHDGAAESLLRAQQAGYRLIIVSNQSGVARGYLSEEQVKAVNQFVIDNLAERGVHICGVYYEPRHPEGIVERYRTADNIRKPADGMFIRAAREHKLDLRSSWVIGDRPGDFLSAFTIGGRGVLVRTGYGAESLTDLPRYAPLKPEFLADNLAGAISSILASRAELVTPSSFSP